MEKVALAIEVAFKGVSDSSALSLSKSAPAGRSRRALTSHGASWVERKVYVGEGASIASTFAHVLTRHGPLGLFRGFSANYLRLGPQTMVTFVVAEFLREKLGLGAVI